MRLPVADRACVRCKDRRVKCDKARPGCQRCAKASLSCPGYDLSHTFLDAGQRVRERYGEAQNSDQPPRPASTVITPQSRAKRMTGSSSLKRKASGDPRALSVPLSNQSLLSEPDPHLAILDVHDDPPQLYQSQDGVLLHDSNPTLYDESIIALSKQMDAGLESAYFNIDPDLYYSSHFNSCGLVADQSQPHPEIDPWSLDMLLAEEYNDPLSPDTSGHDSFSLPDKALADGRSEETAYLTMHFIEVLGPWMDFFDEYMYFQTRVPSRAVKNSMLQSCISAFAAKQLGRLTANEAYFERAQATPSILRIYPKLTPSDWFYKAASYYDRAIASLRVYLEVCSMPSFTAPRENQDPRHAADSSSVNAEHTPPKRQHVSNPIFEDTDRDDLLIAVAILSGYDALDQHDTDLLKHLHGFQALLKSGDLAAAMRQDTNSETPANSAFLARRAVFWNFARVDCTTAYINHKRPRVDVDDITLWRAAGLPITDDCRFILFREDRKTDWSSEESAGRALIWVLLRIMACLIDKTEPSSQHSGGWEAVESLLDSWHEALPASFKPYAQIGTISSGLTKSLPSNTTFMEMLFCKQSCAAAMQLYHFAKILVLLNKPAGHTSQSTGDRLRMYREISRQSEAHGREICGIMLGYLRRPAPPPLVQPLYLAGLCLDSYAERKEVLDLLETMELESGHSTEYRRQELRSQWGWAS